MNIAIKITVADKHDKTIRFHNMIDFVTLFPSITKRDSYITMPKYVTKKSRLSE